MEVDANFWTLTLPPGSNVPAGTPGPMLANGKVAFLPALDRVDTASSFITRNAVDPSRPALQVSLSNQVNALDAFATQRVSLFALQGQDSNYATSLSNLRFSFSNALMDATFRVANSNLDSNAPLAVIQSTTLALQKLPYSALQTLDIALTYQSSNAWSHFASNAPCFYHEVVAPQSLDDVEYNNSVFYLDSGSSSRTLHMLTGRGTFKAVDSAERQQMAFASCYLLSNASQVDVVGFNVLASDPRRAYTKFEVRPGFATPGSGNIQLHVLSATMTTHDFHAPADEVKRILLSVANREASFHAVAAALRADHAAAWTELWGAGVDILPKASTVASSNLTDYEDYKTARLAARWASYTMLATTRSQAAGSHLLDANPFSLSVMDFGAGVLGSGDLWLLPVLVTFRPNVARAILEYRYKQLQSAAQIAAGYGHHGAKFPSADDTLGYSFSTYWDAKAPLRVYNTALVAIHAWNYYRVTLDNEWLAFKGLPVIKGAVDFLVSLCELSQADGKYHVKRTTGLTTDRVSDDAAFTNHLVQAALKAAIETYYTLTYKVPQAWLNIYFNFYVPVLSFDPFADTLAFDAAAAGNSNVGQAFQVPEPLVAVTPWYSELYFRFDATRNLESVERNLLYYDDKIAASKASLPLNVSLLTVVYALLSQHDSATYLPLYHSTLMNYISQNSDPFWKKLVDKSRNAYREDIVVSAMLLVALMAITNARITGGVTETRFYYEEMGVAFSRDAALPAHWLKVISYTLNKTCITLNTI